MIHGDPLRTLTITVMDGAGIVATFYNIQYPHEAEAFKKRAERAEYDVHIRENYAMDQIQRAHEWLTYSGRARW